MNELALFAGAGGGILGGKLLGWRTVCAVECDAYARDVLVARQNDGCLDPFPIWNDVCTFDGKPWRGCVDVVSGGFPCQDISAAGKGAGINGERSGLWREMARIIGEVGPRFVFVENSPLLVGRGLGLVLGDLASMGYDAEWGIVGAHHAAAPHKRERIWIRGELANAGCQGLTTGRAGSGQAKDGEIQHMRTANGGASMADAESTRLERHRSNAGQPQISEPRNDGASTGMADASGTQDHAIGGDSECGRNALGRQQQAAQQDNGQADHNGAGGRGEVGDVTSAGLQNGSAKPMGEPGADAQPQRSDWWATEPDLGRVAHGVAARVDRLRCLGNGQVPGVVRLAWRVLKEGGRMNIANA